MQTNEKIFLFGKKIVSQINSVPKLAKEIEIPRSSVQTTLQNKDKIICKFKSGHKAGIKRKCKQNFDSVNEPLLKWLKHARDKKILQSGEMW